MTPDYIREYHRELDELKRRAGTATEVVVRRAFRECLQKYCRSDGLLLVEEEMDRSNRTRPDGTVKDDLRLPRGHWEAKDEDDDIDAEIKKKIRKGYPTDNIIFENSKIAVLIQCGEEVQRVDMRDVEKLHHLLTVFVRYAPPEIANFHRAIAQFSTDLPAVLSNLRDVIESAHKNNPEFAQGAHSFMMLCRESINPTVGWDDVREMLIQHILTKDIFYKVFDDDQFHKENNIAVRLDELEAMFFTGGTRRQAVDRLRTYYSAITAAAVGIVSHFEKQKFLKEIYERFYTVYNKKAADRLGVVYTPNEIVKFMIGAADKIVYRHFNRYLHDKHVQILDPAAGTGTFIADLIDYLPTAHVAYKYANEIHANEVGILPYYIANLNIEYTYKQKVGEYAEFPNICFVDTLDNVHFRGKGQSDLVGAMSYENLNRVKRQNETDISVVIGNPPYNANQSNENDNNPNRKYDTIDARIKETYVEESNAQKTKQYDMYKRFIRYATDRLKGEGVVAFITNRAYIDAHQDDGFRKVAAREFSAIYVIDLGGDARANGNGGNPGNVFGIKVGVAIGFFVKKKVRDDNRCAIHYYQLDDDKSDADKLAWLADTDFSEINFTRITPDAKNNWLNQTDNDFNKLVCVANKDTKLAKTVNKENAIFKLHALGVSTNRDDWVCDFSVANLQKKVKFFVNFYDKEIARFAKEFHGNGNGKPTASRVSDWVDRTIKWTATLETHLVRGNKIKYSRKNIVRLFYRPFTVKFYLANFVMSDRLTKNHCEMFGKEFNEPNKVICIADSKRIPFCCLAAAQVPSLGLFVEPIQCFSLYRYDDNNNRHSNITEYGLTQFRAHYANAKITAEDIFHYTYAVFHNPDYLGKYAINLQRDLPRVPFYDDFAKWVNWGKELMRLHVEFDKQPLFPLKRHDGECQPGDAKLKANKKGDIIFVDEQTTLTGIPAAAWEYRLGNRSALGWVLNQYKEKIPRDPTVAEKFNAYRFADHKDAVIKLLMQVCTVSVQTRDIVNQMRNNRPQ